MDKRKYNGGHSTKSKKSFDRRKRTVITKNSDLDSFIENMSNDIRVLADSIHSQILNSLIRNGKYYVYMHKLKGECVYIGKGINDRAFVWTSRTNNEHSDLIKNGEIETIILASNLDEQTALLIESSIIMNLNPKYNTLWTEEKTTETKVIRPKPKESTKERTSTKKQ